MTEDSVLVVIDVQNGFVNNRSRHVVASVAALLHKWQAAYKPVIFTRFHNQPGSPFETIIGWTRLRTPEETAIVDELLPYTTHPQAHVLDKDFYSMFNTDGKVLVEHYGWRHLYFTGIATDACVAKSAVDAFELGYIPWVLTDATGSDAGTEAHEAGLLTTGRNIGRRQLITGSQLPI